MEAAAKTYSSTGLAVVSVVSSVVVLSVSALPPQAGQGQRHGQGQNEGEKLFHGEIFLS